LKGLVDCSTPEACLVAQVGMRHFNIRKNKYFCPIVNLDKLWSLAGGDEVTPLNDLF
jgi:hypothetical protein